MKRFALMAMAWLLSSYPVVVSGQLENDLEGYWQFNVNGLDSSFNARDLNLVGTPGFSPGLFDCALRLTGNATQYAIGATNETVFDIGSDDFTIQVWVNFSSTAGEQTLFEKFTGGAGPGYTLTKLPGNGFQFFASGLGVVNSPVQAIATDQWHHLVMRRTELSLEMFFNNVSIIQQNAGGAVTPSPNPVRIGERHGGSQQFGVRGLMDEVAFWSRALTNDEISDLNNNGDGLAMVPPPNVLLGDVNLDGALNLLDVAPFVERIATGDYQAQADMNQDCVINLLDVDPFILALAGGG